LIATIFIWDTYGYMYRKLSGYIGEDMTWKQKLVSTLKYFVLIPAFMVVQTVPRIHALYNVIHSAKQTQWYKTERTREAVATEI
jgi:hypothetical protein